MERNAAMLDHDPPFTHRTPEEIADRARYYAPGRPTFIDYDRRPEAARADPTGTGDPALNAEAARRGECIHLAAAIVRDLIEAARRKRQTIEHRRDVLARIDALLAEAEAIGPAEPWTAAVLFDRRLHNARDNLHRYTAGAAP